MRSLGSAIGNYYTVWDSMTELDDLRAEAAVWLNVTRSLC